MELPTFNFPTPEEFQKDFAEHMQELASEITGLHNSSPYFYRDDLEQIMMLSGQVEETSI